MDHAFEEFLGAGRPEEVRHIQPRRRIYAEALDVSLELRVRLRERECGDLRRYGRVRALIQGARLAIERSGGVEPGGIEPLEEPDRAASGIPRRRIEPALRSSDPRESACRYAVLGLEFSEDVAQGRRRRSNEGDGQDEPDERMSHPPEYINATSFETWHAAP